MTWNSSSVLGEFFVGRLVEGLTSGDEFGEDGGEVVDFGVEVGGGE